MKVQLDFVDESMEKVIAKHFKNSKKISIDM
jgi:hypothetical protein